VVVVPLLSPEAWLSESTCVTPAIHPTSDRVCLAPSKPCQPHLEPSFSLSRGVRCADGNRPVLRVVDSKSGSTGLPLHYVSDTLSHSYKLNARK
jgi:hypothetical protein